MLRIERNCNIPHTLDRSKMADEHSGVENRAEIISNFANAGNST